jgi:hypothetical protein
VGEGGVENKGIWGFFYWGVVRPRTNVRHLYRVGERWRRCGPVRGHLYWSVPPIGTNVVICTGAKKYSEQIKKLAWDICVIL